MDTRVPAVGLYKGKGDSRLCSDTEGTVGGRGRQVLWMRLLSTFLMDREEGGKGGRREEG